MTTTKQGTSKEDPKALPPPAGAKPESVKATIVDNVLAKINQFQQTGELKLPEGYAAANALQSAYLLLTDLTDKDGALILPMVTPASVANALLKMVLLGLSPMKRQCSFIKYGDKLTLQQEYAGTVTLARRFGKLKTVKAQVVYEKDIFEYDVNPETGKRFVIKHEQKLDNIDITKIRGAYAVTTLEDGSVDTEIMTIVQIRQAWLQGKAKGNSPAHNNFTDQMAMKTVIGRACKLLITTSDDANAYDDTEAEVIESKPHQQAIEQGANRMELSPADTTSYDIPKQSAPEIAPVIVHKDHVPAAAPGELFSEVPKKDDKPPY